jgi:heme exporter protein A
VRDVDFSVTPGEVVTLVGPNGAGKTTLLKMLAGLTSPTSGTVERFGSVNAVLHTTLLYDELSARENLRFSARLCGPVDDSRIEGLLDRVGLTAAKDQRVRTFSRGMQQRLSIARALLHDPDVLLLDEPLNSLDEQGGRLVLEILGEQDARAAVVVTHQVDRIFDVTTSVGYLVRGVLHGPTPVAGLDVEDVRKRQRELIANA